MVMNAQWGAVRPTGLRKKPRHLDVLRAQHGQATQQVVASKQQQQADEESAFNKEQAQKSLAMQQEQMKEDKKNAKKQEDLGYLITVMNLFKTIMDFF